MTYEIENPPNLLLEVKRIRGLAVDPTATVIPGIALGLYTESEPHRLLAAATTDEKGKFDFGKSIPPGDYRLIAKYPGLCTANVPIQLSRKGSGKEIQLRMQSPALGGCSTASLR